jgi:hypothetical protein
LLSREKSAGSATSADAFAVESNPEGDQAVMQIQALSLQAATGERRLLAQAADTAHPPGFLAHRVRADGVEQAAVGGLAPSQQRPVQEPGW